MNRKFNIVAAMAAVIFGFVFYGQATAQTDNKIAVIYSDLFMDGKSGIAKLSVISDSLNREFEPRKTEINQLTQKAQTLSDEIEKTAHLADPKTLQLKMDQIDQMKMDLKRKAEDAQAAFDKRREDVFKPLQLAISNAIESYAKAHNIAIIIDGSQVPLSYAAVAVDITRDFINDFNSKNPVTATAPPK